MKAVLRRAMLGIKALGDDIDIDIVGRRGHIKLRISRPGVPPRTLTMASTPTNVDHTVLNVVRDARRALNLEKP